MVRAIKLTLWAATIFVVAWTLSLVSAVVGSKFIKPELQQPIRATED